MGRAWLARVVDGGTLGIGSDGSTFGSPVMCCWGFVCGIPGWEWMEYKTALLLSRRAGKVG